MERSQPVNGSKRRPRVSLWMAGAFFLCFIYFLPRPADWNQDARVDTVLAIVQHGTLAIDPYHWNTGIDSDLYGGHYYANKAPGQSLLGVPAGLAFKGLMVLSGQGSVMNKIGRAATWSQTVQYYYMLQYLETIYTVAIPSTMFLLLFFWFLGYFSTSLANRTVLTLGLGLATNYFSYSQVLYHHVSSAALLFTAFVIVYATSHSGPRGEERARPLASHPNVAASLTGLALGGAVLFDNTAIIGASLVGLYALTRVPIRRWPYLALSGVPPLLVLLGYNFIAYHHPLVTGYSTRGSGVLGTNAAATAPPAALFGLTFSPYRGLFFMSPFLLLAFPGYVLWWRRGGWEWLLCLAIPGTLLIAVSTIAIWAGGYAVGPRYLIPGLPFLTLPIIFVLDRGHSWLARLTTYLLLAVSFAVVWLETLGGRGYDPTSVYNPLFAVSLPAWVHGRMPLSLGTIILYPFTGMNSKWTLVPLACLLLLWTGWCFRPRKQRNAYSTAAQRVSLRSRLRAPGNAKDCSQP